MSTANFPRARAAEAEDRALILDEPVDLIQERGSLLDLIDDHEMGWTGEELFPKKMGRIDVTDVLVRLE